jgi:hypothetical protein
MTIPNALMPRLRLEFLQILSYPLKLAKMECWPFAGNEVQMASSHTLLVPLWISVPRAESVASCLVDGMLFIILQVRSEQIAACASLAMMIPHMTTLNILVSPLCPKYLWILSNLSKLGKMQC